MRLMLGIPTAGSPAAPFLQSLAQLALPPGAQAFERSVVTGNFIPAQRDLLLERAIAWNADVLIMCDDDMIVPPHALIDLCAVLDSRPRAAVAGALYYSRDGLRPMAVGGWDCEDTAKGWVPAFDDATPVAVDGVGSGCMAIRIAAVAGFARPYFPAHVLVERSEGRVRVCDEDYLFCARVRAAGGEVILHPGVRCGHYDRARNAVAPSAWESPRVSGHRRVLARTGERYELVALDQAPAQGKPERHVRADVVYVETE